MRENKAPRVPSASRLGYRAGKGGERRRSATAIYLVLEINAEISEALDKSRRPPSRGFISQDVAGNGEIMGRVGRMGRGSRSGKSSSLEVAVLPKPRDWLSEGIRIEKFAQLPVAAERRETETETETEREREGDSEEVSQIARRSRRNDLYRACSGPREPTDSPETFDVGVTYVGTCDVYSPAFIHSHEKDADGVRIIRTPGEAAARGQIYADGYSRGSRRRISPS